MKQREGQKQERRGHILQHALECFIENGIEVTTVADVASAAKVGEATIYRYFTTKNELVCQSAGLLWRNATDFFEQRFQTPENLQKNGIDQLRAMLMVFVEIFEDHARIMGFIYSFDNYVLKHHLNRDSATKYAKNLFVLRRCFMHAVETGLRDGTLRSDYNWEDVYWTTCNVISTLSQKLVIYSELYSVRPHTSPKHQLELTCEILLNGFAP